MGMDNISPHPELKLLAISELLKVIPISRTKLFELRRDGKFPKPIQISPSRVGFLAIEISEWMAFNRAAY